MIKLLTGAALIGFFSLFGAGSEGKKTLIPKRTYINLVRDTDVIDSLEAELMEEAAEETEWTENNDYFRYAIDDKTRGKIMILQKKTGAQWKEAGRYKIGKYGFRITDWNKDGLDDIAIVGKRSEQILLFDPGENIFKDAGKFGFDIKNLEGNQNIFYDLFYGAEKGSWGSTLFRMNNHFVQKLAYAEFVPDKLNETTSRIEVYTISTESEKFLKDTLNEPEAKLKYNEKQNNEAGFNTKDFLKKYWMSFYSKL